MIDWDKIRLAGKGPDVKERARVSEGKHRREQYLHDKKTEEKAARIRKEQHYEKAARSARKRQDSGNRKWD